MVVAAAFTTFIPRESVYVRGDSPQTGSLPFVGILTRTVDEKRCNQDMALYDKNEYYAGS